MNFEFAIISVMALNLLYNILLSRRISVLAGHVIHQDINHKLNFKDKAAYEVVRTEDEL